MELATYLVERYLPGSSPEAIEAAAARASATTAELAAEGVPVRYLGTTFVPEDEACFCQFEAPSAEVVLQANRRARLPVDRVVACVHVPGPHDKVRVAPDERTER
jgi:hypothetical protein